MRTRRSALERYGPLAHFGLALALVALLLPTALRPPEPPPSSSAEFSPNAPPDEEQPLFSTLTRAASATAGSGPPGIGIGEGPGGGAAGPGGARGCKFGFGNPPKQTDSAYAPPCAPAFTGDNGGATFRGVTANEIRIGIAENPISSGRRTSYDGCTPDEPRPNESAPDRTYRIWQSYFSQAFELYGRKLRLCHLRPGSGAAPGKAAMQTFHTQYQPFAIYTNQQFLHDEATRLGYPAFGSYHRPQEYYARDAPYAWSWVMDGTQLARFSAEVICKQFAGKPPDLNERHDPTFDYNKPRRFGAIWIDSLDYATLVNPFQDELARCNEKADVTYYTLSTDEPGSQGTTPSETAAAVTKMKAAGVTTIACGCDLVSLAAFTFAASNQSYFPEWVVTATSEIDSNTVGRLMDPRQWRHAAGISFTEMAMPPSMRDYHRAYKQIDPDTEPHDGAGRYAWPFIFQIVVGLQMAGPVVNPQTFAAGMARYRGRFIPEPPWYVAGGYGPGDYTFADYVSLVWWNPTARDPDGGLVGAYTHLNGGKRYRLGEIPTEPQRWFHDGIVGPPG